MWPRAALLAFCCLASSVRGGLSPESCSQDLDSGVRPGFPQTIKTNDPGVLRAARHSVERFNNCTNDIFLFKESLISRALVQVVKGLKYMLEVEIGRTTCRKNKHPHLDNCDFQTSPALKRMLSCYSEVWVLPWLQSFKAPYKPWLRSWAEREHVGSLSTAALIASRKESAPSTQGLTRKPPKPRPFRDLSYLHSNSTFISGAPTHLAM